MKSENRRKSGWHKYLHDNARRQWKNTCKVPRERKYNPEFYTQPHCFSSEKATETFTNKQSLGNNIHESWGKKINPQKFEMKKEQRKGKGRVKS